MWTRVFVSAAALVLFSSAAGAQVSSPVAAPPAVATTPAIADVPPTPPAPPVAAVAMQAPVAAQAPETPAPGGDIPRIARTPLRRIEAATPPSKGVNVRIDATVIEAHGEQVTGRKMLTVTLVDGEWGSVRSSQQVAFQPKGSSGYSYRTAPLNMDARAFLRDDGRIKVALTLEYRGGPGEGGSSGPSENAQGAVDEGIRQNVTVLLESGKPLIVAQSADAVGDRRVSLEVKATVLK